MTHRDIIDAYCHIRKTDHTIPDEVLNFMYQAALEKLDDIPKSKEEQKAQEKEWKKFLSEFKL
jgi:uncharacterized protein YecT (DUF1311 family)